MIHTASDGISISSVQIDFNKKLSRDETVYTILALDKSDVEKRAYQDFIINLTAFSSYLMY